MHLNQLPTYEVSSQMSTACQGKEMGDKRDLMDSSTAPRTPHLQKNLKLVGCGSFCDLLPFSSTHGFLNIYHPHPSSGVRMLTMGQQFNAAFGSRSFFCSNTNLGSEVMLSKIALKLASTVTMVRIVHVRIT